MAYVGKNGTAAEVGHIPASNTDISDLFVKHRDTQVICDFVRCMAVPVATEINILDPEAVFLGGGIVQIEEFPREQLIEHILANTRKPYSAENIQIYFSNQSPENGIVGAAVMEDHN